MCMDNWHSFYEFCHLGLFHGMLDGVNVELILTSACNTRCVCASVVATIIFHIALSRGVLKLACYD